jgi:hypothetical protein
MTSVQTYFVFLYITESGYQSSDIPNVVGQLFSDILALTAHFGYSTFFPWHISGWNIELKFYKVCCM